MDSTRRRGKLIMAKKKTKKSPTERQVEYLLGKGPLGPHNDPIAGDPSLRGSKASRAQARGLFTDPEPDQRPKSKDGRKRVGKTDAGKTSSTIGTRKKSATERQLHDLGIL
jgi:hypothetical protein